MDSDTRSTNLLLRLAGLSGLLAVALGAFGAHKLNDLLVANGKLAVWQTAALYHLVHSVAALWGAKFQHLAAWFWLVGIVIFSGSLYLLALTNFGKLGMITPLGGLFLLGGWLCVLIKGTK